MTPASSDRWEVGIRSPRLAGWTPCNHIHVNTAMNTGMEIRINQNIRLNCTIGIDKLSTRIRGARVRDIRN